MCQEFMVKYTSMAAIDWTHIYKKYKGLWVALMDDEITVIASGKTAKEVWGKAQKKGFTKPILMSVPEKLTYFIG